MDDYFPEAYGLAQAAGQLRGRNASLKRQLSEAQETIENWQDHASDLEKKLRDTRGQIAQAERKAAIAQRAADQAQHKLTCREGTWLSLQQSDEKRYRQLKGRYDDLLAQLSALQATIAARDEELALTKNKLARSLRNQEYFRHQANLGLAHEAGLAAAISVLVEALKETSPLYEEACIGVDTPEGHEPARIEVSARQARAAAIAEIDLPETHLAQLMAERDDAPELPFTWDEAKSPS